MARRGLEERIEAWPEQWREARTRLVEAKALVAKLELQLERAKERAGIGDARMRTGGDFDDVAGSRRYVLGAGRYSYDAVDERLLELERQVQLATLAADRAKAEADIRVRESALAAGQKLTEAAVGARVKSDPGYIAAQEKLLEARHQQSLGRIERRQEMREEEMGEESASPVFVEEEEPEAVRQLRIQLDDAYQQLEKARTDLGYQTRVGQALQMLTEVLKADSVVAAAVPLSRR